MFMINILGDLHKRVSHGYQFLLKRVLFLLAQLRSSRGIKSRRSANDGGPHFVDFRALEFARCRRSASRNHPFQFVNFI